MKAVFIIFNQALTERVNFIFEQLRITGFTKFPLVHGAGSKGGEPRMGSHAWPEMNSCVITIVPDEKAPALLEAVKKLDKRNEEVGVRAFMWNVEATV